VRPAAIDHLALRLQAPAGAGVARCPGRHRRHLPRSHHPVTGARPGPADCRPRGSRRHPSPVSPCPATSPKDRQRACCLGQTGTGGPLPRGVRHLPGRTAVGGPWP
jgi:hypothetical protein